MILPLRLGEICTDNVIHSLVAGKAIRTIFVDGEDLVLGHGTAPHLQRHDRPESQGRPDPRPWAIVEGAGKHEDSPITMYLPNLSVKIE
jgi:hypothetical protein